MTVRRLRNSVVKAIDAWGKRPVYRARIIHADIGGIVLRSARRLEVGKRVVFAVVSELPHTSKASGLPARKWRSGVIWRIENGCLHLTRT